MKCDGTALSTGAVANPQACADLCTAEGTCVYWTHNLITTDCSLYIGSECTTTAAETYTFIYAKSVDCVQSWACDATCTRIPTVTTAKEFGGNDCLTITEAITAGETGASANPCADGEDSCTWVDCVVDWAGTTCSAACERTAAITTPSVGGGATCQTFAAAVAASDTTACAAGTDLCTNQNCIVSWAGPCAADCLKTAIVTNTQGTGTACQTFTEAITLNAATACANGVDSCTTEDCITDWSAPCDTSCARAGVVTNTKTGAGAVCETFADAVTSSNAVACTSGVDACP